MTDTSARVDRVCTVFNKEYPLVLWCEKGRNSHPAQPVQPRRTLLFFEPMMEGRG